MTPAAGALCLLTLAACGGVASTEPADFSVRGRWAEPLAITYRVERDDRGPLPAEPFAAAVERAIAAWNATGLVRLSPGSGAGDVDVTIGFRRGHHGACEPFGPTTALAHAGPPHKGTYVHFDAARAWRDESVFGTALHELGHVLGLGHAEASDAVMSNDPTRPTALSRHELAALGSLYGGGVDRDGDLRIATADGARLAVLRGVAPAACCGFAVFDADGDRCADVLVWRTDAPGHGDLRIFAFTAGAQLVRTLGPFPGVIGAGATVGCVVGPAGERLLVSTFANGVRLVRQFDEHGVPALPTRAIADEVLATAGSAAVGDLDGDGRGERVERIAP